MLQIWLLYDFYFLVCAMCVRELWLYVGMYSLATIYGVTHIQESRNHTVIKFAASV